MTIQPTTPEMNAGQEVFFVRFFSLVRFSRASFFSKSFFDTVSTMLSALLMRSASVFPGTCGAGSGFIAAPRDSNSLLVSYSAQMSKSKQYPHQRSSGPNTVMPRALSKSLSRVAIC
jgi:hypothetical protein